MLPEAGLHSRKVHHLLEQGRPDKLSLSRQDKGRVQEDFPDETKPAADGFFHWKCHVCFERRKSETKDRLRDIKRTHRRSKHPEILGRTSL